MAKIVIQRSWPDEDDLCVAVEVEDSFPDVIREAARAAVDAYTEALAITLAGNDSGDVQP